jgi:hypothetical protein
MYLLNEQEIFSKWSPILESEVGITDRTRVEWMSKYCHYHELYESNSTATLGAVNGMGSTRFPGDPGSQTDFYTQDTGSGDKAHTLLPLAMQVAAQTVGLDLVPVVPMPGPMGVLTYLDFVYAGGKTNGTGADIPLLVKQSYSDYASVPTFTAGNTGSTAGVTFAFVGQSRIDGMPIFHITGTLSSGQTVATALDSIVIGGLTGGTAGQFTVELVKALEDHITGFSGASLSSTNGNPQYDGFDINDPYSRADGEGTTDNVMNLSLFNKSVEAKTFQVAAAVTREQVQDLKQFGVDAVSQVESVLINELTQSINKNILDRLFFLGERNHEFVVRTQGLNFFLNLGQTAIQVAGTTSGDVCNPATNFGAYIQSTSLRDQVVNQTEVANSASENLHTRQRKIMSKVLAIANLIAIRGRRGPATFVVTNGQVCSALQDVAGFIPAPMANTINQMAGSLYPIGTLAGLAIYNDPNRAWNDTRFCVGRKGDGNSPGLVFMPYLMAESVQTIAEGTMAPKVAVKSRYALVEAGFHPETMYLTSGVNLAAELGSLV